ncbi:MAG: ATP-binding protein [bacterium]|nr:ATP-binding protein [bacterium]
MIIIPSINFIFAFLFASLTAVLFLGQERNATRTFAIVGLCVTGWVIGLGAYFYVADPYWLVFWNRYNHVLVGLIAVAFFYFSLIFPNKSRASWGTELALLIVELIFLFLYFYTDIIIADSHLLTSPTVSRYPDLFQAVGPIFYAHFFGFFLLGFILLARTIKESLLPAIATQARYLLWGSVLGVIPAILVDIILPKLGNYSFYGYAGALTSGWVLFTAYAIARHQLFNVRLVLTSIAASSVLSIAGILGLELSSNTSESLGILGRVALFIAFLIVGIFLLYNIRRGEDRRLQLAKIEKDLKTLNEELIERVAQRSANLKKEQEHVDRILDDLADGLVELDSNFHVLRVNKIAEELLGVVASDIVGRALTPHDANHSELEAITRITFPSSPGQEVSYSDKRGVRAAVTEVVVHYPHQREIEVATITFGSILSGTSYIKILRDVTAQKELARNKSTFITTAAHRLRTPLSSTKWALGGLLENAQKKFTNKQIKILERVLETNEAMIRLVNSLLNTAHIEEGRYGFTFEPTNIPEIILSVIQELTPLAKQKNITLSAVIPDEIVEPSADKGRIKQVIENLVDNAIRYSKEGGTITINAKSLPSMIRVGVYDDGKGISQKDRQRLFSKFYRGDETDNASGSGLGLYIAQKIAQEHGGDLVLDSTYQDGAGFVLTLPINTNPKER